MSAIFGGSKQKSNNTSTSNSLSSSESYNQAYPWMQAEFGDLASSNANEGISGLARLLGGDSSGFDKYMDATGFNAAAESGSRGITGNAAASGLLRSGGTGQALQKFGNDLRQSYSGNYMDKLLQQAQFGSSLASLIGGTGQRSSSTGNSSSYGTGTSSGSSSNGMGGFLGGLLGGL